VQWAYSDPPGAVLGPIVSMECALIHFCGNYRSSHGFKIVEHLHWPTWAPLSLAVFHSVGSKTNFLFHRSLVDTEISWVALFFKISLT
jgi:hypothetical protein